MHGTQSTPVIACLETQGSERHLQVDSPPWLLLGECDRTLIQGSDIDIAVGCPSSVNDSTTRARRHEGSLVPGELVHCVTSYT